MKMKPKGSDSFVDTIKKNVEQFFTNIQISSEDVIRFVSCFGIGFVVGLAGKRYGKYVISALLLVTLLLATLQYFNLIVINDSQIKLLLGFQSTDSFDTVITSLVAQVKVYYIELGTILLGTLLGFKFG